MVDGFQEAQRVDVTHTLIEVLPLLLSKLSLEVVDSFQEAQRVDVTHTLIEVLPLLLSKLFLGCGGQFPGGTED